MPGSARAELARVVELLHLTNASIPPAENLHCTLAFLGNVEDGVAIADALQGVRSDGTIPTALTGLGAFPSVKRARVVWAGLDDSAGQIADLARNVAEVLAPHGFRSEKRAFRAHLTLARLRAPLRVTLDAQIEPIAFEINQVTLMQSVLRGSKHPTYEPVLVVRLG